MRVTQSWSLCNRVSSDLHPSKPALSSKHVDSVTQLNIALSHWHVMIALSETGVQDVEVQSVECRGKGKAETSVTWQCGA